MHFSTRQLSLSTRHVQYSSQVRVEKKSECDTFHGNNMTFVFGETASHYGNGNSNFI